MNKELDCQKAIGELYYLLHQVRFQKDITLSVVRLMFLKYAADNFIGAVSRDEMMLYNRLQKLLTQQTDSGDFAPVVAVLELLDNTYSLNGLLTSSATIENYAADLFGAGLSQQKKTSQEVGAQKIRSFLSKLDLENPTDSNAVGEKLLSALSDYLRSLDMSTSSIMPTNLSLVKLAVGILNIQPGDTYCDIAAGTGLSSLAITGATDTEFTNIEISEEYASIEAMLAIIAGRKNFHITCADSMTQIVPGIHAEKIFVDGPLSGKLMKNDDNPYTDATLAIIHRTMNNYLSEDGMAVVTCPARMLFNMGKHRDCRQELVSKRNLAAVIGLASLWGRTVIQTYLMILTKKSNDRVIFIDASDEYVKVGNSGKEISDDQAKKILAALQNPENYPGFAYAANDEELKAKDYMLVPRQYVENQDTHANSITIAEIDCELSRLYQQLNDAAKNL